MSAYNLVAGATFFFGPLIGLMALPRLVKMVLGKPKEANPAENASPTGVASRSAAVVDDHYEEREQRNARREPYITEVDNPATAVVAAEAQAAPTPGLAAEVAAATAATAVLATAEASASNVFAFPLRGQFAAQPVTAPVAIAEPVLVPAGAPGMDFPDTYAQFDHEHDHHHGHDEPTWPFHD